LTKTVLIQVTTIGSAAGPFNISDDLSGVVASGVTASQLINGYYVIVDYYATAVYIQSTGVCNTDIKILINPDPTLTSTAVNSPTPTPTQTSTPTNTLTPTSC
jgi:hypothetical protein